MITSAGRRGGLVGCFRAAAERLGHGLTVVAGDLQPDLSAACGLADIAVALPPCDDPAYAQTVLDVARQHNVRMVVPTIDPELQPLAQAAERFAAEGIFVHVSDTPTIHIARDKARTAEAFARAGVPVPRTVDEAALRADPDCLDWPVFAKPAGGSASRGLARFSHPDDLPKAFPEPMIFQDDLRGEEFTINMFVDQSGVLKCVIPHRRLAVRAGEVDKGQTTRREDLTKIAHQITRALPGLRGVACFQIIDDARHGPRVFEINARFGGGYPLADHAGAQFAQWLLEERLGRRCSAHDTWRDGVRMLRYDTAVFVD